MEIKGSMLAIGILCLVIARACHGSAIPMWEFLTRDEKTSHLYRIFSQEVGEYCAESSMPDCNKNLLITGLKNLANLNDDELDEMDPYQRNAKDIIWRSIVGNANRQQSSRLGQHSFHANEDDPLAAGDNELAQESSSSKDYARPSEQQTGPYLTGPMVIRVYPDGRPVLTDAERPLPKDEDIDDIRTTDRLPTIMDIAIDRANASSERYDDVATTTELKVPSMEILPPRRTSARSGYVGAGSPSYRERDHGFYQQQQQQQQQQRRAVNTRPNQLLVRERFY